MAETVTPWLILHLASCLVHPVFMGMVIPFRLRRWWQIALLVAGVALFHLPKLIWGGHSTLAAIFHLLRAPALLVAVPVLFFAGPLWKRLLVNLLLFGGQFVGAMLAVFLLGDPYQIRDANEVVFAFTQGAVYMAVGLFSAILVDSGVVILARAMQARRFSLVYLPVLFILASLFGTFYAYVAPPQDAAAAARIVQTVDTQAAISISYIWIETAAYVICALLMLVWTVEKDLPEEQKAIAARKKTN